MADPISTLPTRTWRRLPRITGRQLVRAAWSGWCAAVAARRAER